MSANSTSKEDRGAVRETKHRLSIDVYHGMSMTGFNVSRNPLKGYDYMTSTMCSVSALFWHVLRLATTKFKGKRIRIAITEIN